MKRHIGNLRNWTGRSTRHAIATGAGLMTLSAVVPCAAAPVDSGTVETAMRPHVGDHALLFDLDDVARAEATKAQHADAFDDGGVKFGSSATLGANAILLRGLTVGALLNLARYRNADGDSSTVGGALRTGYLISLGGPFTLWPNTSVGYSRMTSPYHVDGFNDAPARDYDEKTHIWQAGGEVRLITAVADHVGLSAGVKYAYQFARASTFNDYEAHGWEGGDQTISADLGLAAWF